MIISRDSMAGAIAFVVLSFMFGTAVRAETPPGQKRNWVVTVGSLGYDEDVNDGVVDTDEWVRLGYYTFDTDGTVTTNYWYWASKSLPPRETPVFADCPRHDPPAPEWDVPNCDIQTSAGFSGSPTGGFVGEYGYLGDGRLRITWAKWSDGSALPKPLNEYWTLEAGLLSGRLARIKSPTFYQRAGSQAVSPLPGVFTDYSANFGVGYGSQATLSYTSRATMSQLVNDPVYSTRDYRGFNPSTAWVTGTQPEIRLLNALGAGGRWTYANGGVGNEGNGWTLCESGKCIGWRQKNSSCTCGTSDKDQIMYIAEVGGGRRNTSLFWCHCHLPQGGACYLRNSHIRPMLQVIDDDGNFQGWVGVETSNHVRNDGRIDEPEHAHYGVFDQVAPEIRVNF